MKFTPIIAILILYSVSASADDSSCPKTVGMIAIRLFPEDILEGHASFYLKLGERLLPSPATPSTDPNLKNLWISTSTAPLALSDIKNLVPSVACIDFTKRTAPLVTRLLDGKCYAKFEFLAKPKCWSLRVKTRPYGYPFQVRLGDQSKPPRLESDTDPDWNLERDLPIGSATVEIFDRKQSKLLLLAIKDITYVRLKSDPETWKLDKDRLDEYFSVPDNQNEVFTEAERLVRKRLIRQLEYIHLQLDGAKQQ